MLAPSTYGFSVRCTTDEDAKDLHQFASWRRWKEREERLQRDHAQSLEEKRGIYFHTFKVKKSKEVFNDNAKKIAEEITEGPVDYYVNLLDGLLIDIGFGYLSLVADKAHGKALDKFPDYAKVHWIEGNIRVSGAIAGVVFEDCLRCVSSKAGIYEEGRKLGSLISLHKFSETKARLARIAVQVRTKAILTQCDGFNEKEVGVAIDFTRELISD